MSQKFPPRFLPRAIFSGLLGGCLLSGISPVHAQQTSPATSPSSPDKIAPTTETPPAGNAHEALLAKLYPADVLTALTDNFDNKTPGGYPAVLARARAAGIPECMLAESEAMRAVFDGNFAAFAATVPRLRAARASWQERNSVLPTFQDFDNMLTFMNQALAREATVPGSFAQASVRLRKRDIARAVYYDLRAVESGADQYAILHNVRNGTPIAVPDWLTYASTKSHVWSNRGLDVIGHPFGPQAAALPAMVPPETYQYLSDAVPDSFWAPYRIPGRAPAPPLPGVGAAASAGSQATAWSGR